MLTTDLFYLFNTFEREIPHAFSGGSMSETQYVAHDLSALIEGSIKNYQYG